MISPDFRKAAQHTILYALERQEALDEALTDALGKYRWDLDLSRHQITFSGEERVLEARADLLASIAAKPASLCGDGRRSWPGSSARTPPPSGCASTAPSATCPH